ncbi:MAG: hypothetical protein DME02_19965 [Candidatus Rokuibacteriota bacterium]|nr:MAG: hypothetical protein DME02_19965 [Candidatus Rokubacteria bacterium]
MTAPACAASHASRALIGRGLAAVSGSRPRFFATIVSKAAGFGGMPSMMKSTNRALLSKWKAGLKRRSKPIVDAAFALIARPHELPAPWAG